MQAWVDTDEFGEGGVKYTLPAVASHRALQATEMLPAAEWYVDYFTLEDGISVSWTSGSGSVLAKNLAFEGIAQNFSRPGNSGGRFQLFWNALTSDVISENPLIGVSFHGMPNAPGMRARMGLSIGSVIRPYNCAK